MKRFRFRFESVEKVRKVREEDALRALGRAQADLQTARSNLAELEKELELGLKNREFALSEKETGQIHGNAAVMEVLRIQDLHVSGTKQRIQWAKNTVSRYERGVDKAMRAYLFARRQMRMVEILRERDLEQYKKELSRHQQKNLDDYLVMRAKPEGDAT